MSGYPEVVAKMGTDFSYQLAPRAKIFRRDEGKVVDLDTMKHIMRYNGKTLLKTSFVNVTVKHLLEYLHNNTAYRSLRLQIQHHDWLMSFDAFNFKITLFILCTLYMELFLITCSYKILKHNLYMIKRLVYSKVSFCKYLL